MSSHGHSLGPPSASTHNLISSSMGGLSSANSSSKDLPATSLSVNFLPQKFSRPHSPGMHRRKGGRMPKQGGGREAFKPGEARMPGKDDDDYGGVDWLGGGSSGKTKPKLRWNKFKWVLCFANLLLTVYSLLALVFCLLTWFNIWEHADIIRVANRPELILSSVACVSCLITSLIGWSGIVLNNRAFLAVYTFMLWVSFALLVAPGYYTCRRREYNLEGKVNFQWSRNLGVDGRLRVQNQLKCCGYFSPFVEATISQTCYSRSVLPGCKGPFLRFQRTTLQRWYLAAFGLVPLHLFCMFVALLCSNHVTYRFGKGMMPKAYRLSMNSMAVLMDKYAGELANQYGASMPSDSKSALGVSQRGYSSDSMGPPPSPMRPYGAGPGQHLHPSSSPARGPPPQDYPRSRGPPPSPRGGYDMPPPGGPMAPPQRSQTYPYPPPQQDRAPAYPGSNTGHGSSQGHGSSAHGQRLAPPRSNTLGSANTMYSPGGGPMPSPMYPPHGGQGGYAPVDPQTPTYGQGYGYPQQQQGGGGYPQQGGYAPTGLHSPADYGPGQGYASSRGGGGGYGGGDARLRPGAQPGRGGTDDEYAGPQNARRF